MWNISPIALRNTSLFIRELTIAEIMQIAKIPYEQNEMRINSFINYVTDNNEMAFSLTVQERYFILLNYLALSESTYSDNTDNTRYFLPPRDEVPEFIQIDEVYVSHLYGSHATALQSQCENAFEWLCGEIALQMYGDLTPYFYSSDKINESDPERIVWEKVESNDLVALAKIINERFEQLQRLTDPQFDTLTDVFYRGCDVLMHLLDTSGLDNDGITVLAPAEENGTLDAARFRPFDGLSATTLSLAKLITK